MTFCGSGASKIFAQRSVAQEPRVYRFQSCSHLFHGPVVALMQDIAPTPANSSFLKFNSTEPR